MNTSEDSRRDLSFPDLFAISIYFFSVLNRGAFLSAGAVHHSGKEGLSMQQETPEDYGRVVSLPARELFPLLKYDDQARNFLFLDRT